MGARRKRTLVLAGVFAVWLLHCGGRMRNLELEDVQEIDEGFLLGDGRVPPIDTGRIEVAPPPSCGGTARTLTNTRAEVLLVVDRSGSMSEFGRDGVSKWNALRASLRSVLPRVSSRISLGVLMFPGRGSQGELLPALSCEASQRVEVETAFNNHDAVMTAIDRSQPYGGTPTAGALIAADNYFRSVPDMVGRRFLLLATDGAPNCNLEVPYAGCRCTGQSGSCVPSAMNSTPQLSCLDDTRTVNTLRSLASMGVQTFVIGLPGTERFADVLDAMAVAGGRARMGSPRYFSATSSNELTAAMNAITSELFDCTFTLEMAPTDPDQVDVRLGGTSIPKDPMRRNGWEWTEGSGNTRIEFFGTACDRLRGAGGGEQLIAAFGCPPVPAPP